MKPYQITSDLLEQQFGELQVELLLQSRQQRFIRILSRSSGLPLEYALVQFNEPAVQRYMAVHQLIVAGDMMGKAFRQAGVTFERQELARYPMSIPIGLPGLFQPDGTDMTLIFVDIKIGPEKALYARNLELYAPEIIWPDNAKPPTDMLALEIDRQLAAVSQLWRHLPI